MSVLEVFETYQKARVEFVQTIAELATRPQNIEVLQNAGERDDSHPSRLEAHSFRALTRALAPSSY